MKNLNGKNKAYAILLAIGIGALGVDQMVGVEQPQAVGAAEVQQTTLTNLGTNAGSTTHPASDSKNLIYHPSIRRAISMRFDTLNVSQNLSVEQVRQAFLPDESWISQSDLIAGTAEAESKYTIFRYAKELSLKGVMKDSALINGKIIKVNTKIQSTDGKDGPCTLLKVSKKGILINTPSGDVIILLKSGKIIDPSQIKNSPK